MKRAHSSRLVAGFFLLQLVVGRASAADRTHEIGIQAYVYAYPMILMEITRRVSTNVERVAEDAPRHDAVVHRPFASLTAFNAAIGPASVAT